MASTWSSGTASSPTANQVIVTTGAIANAHNMDWTAVVNSTLAADFLLQHIDGSSAILSEQELSVLANNATPFPQLVTTVAVNDEIRVIMKSGLNLGRVSASIFWV